MLIEKWQRRRKDLGYAWLIDADAMGSMSSKTMDAEMGEDKVR
jgi:hypothetical protein